MPAPRLFIRADGNAAIGLGHLVRCLALAEMLGEAWAALPCTFLVRAPTAGLSTQLRSAGLALRAVPDTGDQAAEAAWLAEQLQPGDLLVLDGYQFGPAFQRQLSRRHFGLVCLDDLVVAPAWADLVINQAGGVAPQAYAAAPGAELCLGPAFALLRAPFRQAAPGEAPYQGRLFVSMGGADPDNHTARLLEQLTARFPGQPLSVVTGASYPHADRLAQRLARHPGVRHFHDVDAARMRELMQEADLLVCPPSGLAYEACATGGLLLLHQTAANQQGLFDFLTGAGLALPLAALPTLPAATLPEWSERLRARQRALFDGQAATRLAGAFARLHQAASLHLRRAAAADCALYFGWANDEEVRRHALQPAPIPWSSHQAWFARRLADPDTYLLVAELDQQPIGQVRVEFAGEQGFIDYSVAADYRGRGLGRALLRRAIHLLRHHRPGPWTLVAQVKTTNPASARVFEQLRFTRQPAVVVAGQPLHVFHLPVAADL